MNLARYLDHQPFFRGLSPESRARLADIAASRRAPRDAVLFREGEPGQAVHLLALGSVELSRASRDGPPAIIKLVRPGEIFAETVLFESDVYPVTARAREDSEVVCLPRAAVRRLLAEEDFRADYLRMMMQKQRYLARQIAILSEARPEERLLTYLREEFGPAPELRIALSKKDVAAAIGITPETLSRALARLRRARRLEWQRDRIIRPAPKRQGGRHD